ncbi:hypothetical protein EDD37DRAFT_696035 [Exophiala viscosa]|uniref:uncharacterized protein n=1 Tax=Exophiala viscosa TaxID=2486360 RepID=UPI0021A248FF|nr:hypothetical protein EDD37DRAFT_696035 [Exophiala viscosa]
MSTTQGFRLEEQAPPCVSLPPSELQPQTEKLISSFKHEHSQNTQPGCQPQAPAAQRHEYHPHTSSTNNAPWADDLAGFDIHPIWRSEAFRLAVYDDFLSVPELDRAEYNYSPEMYERMMPALRLATLFLKTSTPVMARIRYAPFAHFSLTEGGQVFKALDEAGWRETPEKLKSFEQDLLRMCTPYRITVVSNDCPMVLETDAAREGQNVCAISDLQHHHDHKSPLKVDCPHTALSTQWIEFLRSPDWDTMDVSDKYSQLLSLALTLVHELAHAVWSYRKASELEYDRRCPKWTKLPRGHLREPRYGSMEWAELGYVAEMMIMGGLQELMHLEVNINLLGEKVPYLRKDIHFAQLDNNGSVVSVQTMEPMYTQVFFNGATWAEWIEGKAAWSTDFIPGRVELMLDQPERTRLTLPGSTTACCANKVRSKHLVPSKVVPLPPRKPIGYMSI